MSDLYEKLIAVGDRETFLRFAMALAFDRKETAAMEKSRPLGAELGGWQNSTIEDFLDAAIAWGESSKEKSDGLPLDASWNAFARFLYCGKIYE